MTAERFDIEAILWVMFLAVDSILLYDMMGSNFWGLEYHSLLISCSSNFRV